MSCTWLALSRHDLPRLIIGDMWLPLVWSHLCEAVPCPDPAAVVQRWLMPAAHSDHLPNLSFTTILQIGPHWRPNGLQTLNLLKPFPLLLIPQERQQPASTQDNRTQDLQTPHSKGTIP